MNLKIIELAVIFAIALYTVREPEVLLIGMKAKPRRPEAMSFGDLETLRQLRLASAVARKDRERYIGRHRVISQAEYRSALSTIGHEEDDLSPEQAETLLTPWNPNW